jgi:hypothetical protein
MSAVVQLPLLNTPSPYLPKDKTPDPRAPAFTAVNGRNPPPSACISSSTSGMSAEQSPSLQHEQCHSPTLSSQDSLDSPNNRKRTDSPEEKSGQVGGTEAPQHRPLPPIQRPSEPERRWTAEPQTRNDCQERRDLGSMDPIHSSRPPIATNQAPHGEPNGFEPGNRTEHSRAAIINLNPRKRKREFVNRTKTGCGTCRSRKKKCDEAKPECTLVSFAQRQNRKQ